MAGPFFAPPLDLARSAGVCVSGGAGGIVFGGRFVGVPLNLSSESQPAQKKIEPIRKREMARLVDRRMD